MKPITIHPGSALAGAAIVVLVGALSAQQVVGRLLDVRIVRPVIAQVDPHPRDFVRIVEGQPFAVPSHRRLVVTSLGHNATNGPHPVELRVDGVIEARVLTGYITTELYSDLIQLPTPGIMAGPGSVVEVQLGGVNPDDARAWGYLVDN